MAYIALRVLLLFHFSSYYCLSQNMEELLFTSVREAVGEIRALSLKVTEMENTMSSKFEEMENTMSSKFEELDGKIDNMQGQLVEQQGSSNVEDVLQLCADTMEMERKFQSDIFNQTCNHIDQMANLQESLSTELHRIERTIKGCSSKVSNLHELLAIDECAAADSNDCSPHASCQDKMILYRCNCDPGYVGDGFTCEDVDECSSTGETSCHRNAVCNNVQGGYTCTCDSGFSGDGFNCEDVDECSSTGGTSCHRNAVCNNVPGGYTCTCDSGFSGDEFNCEDVDECSSTGENGCHLNALCNNVQGGYTCTCARGFSGDGFNCEGCGIDFTDVPGVGCLKVIEEQKTFADASTHCSTLGAQLVVSQHFQTFQDYIDSIPWRNYWIGVSNRKWLDGRDVAAYEWRARQPDGDVTMCGYITTNINGINDIRCNYSTNFICQLKYNAP